MQGDAQPATKGDLKLLQGELKADMAALHDELMRYMDIVAENLLESFKGIFSDRLEQHEQRITHIEGALGISTAAA